VGSRQFGAPNLLSSFHWYRNAWAEQKLQPHGRNWINNDQQCESADDGQLFSLAPHDSLRETQGISLHGPCSSQRSRVKMPGRDTNLHTADKGA